MWIAVPWLVPVAALAGAGAALALDAGGGEDARWVSGGVGEGERVEMLLALPDYTLRVLTAAEKSGEYLSDVEVQVRDAAGGFVLETILDGPFLFARLAPGTYEVRATYGGRTQLRTVTIPASGRRELFLYWPVPDAETVPRSEAWQGWLAAHSTAEGPPPQIGAPGDGLPPLGDAPGQYVVAP
jgi:hypothetical protein